MTVRLNVARLTDNVTPDDYSVKLEGMMKGVFKTTTVVAGIGVFLLSGMLAYAQQATPASPEVPPLNRFVGTWKMQQTIKTANGPDITLTGVVTHKLVLGDRFLESTSVSNPGEQQVLQMSIWDDMRRLYRSWYFDSNGRTSEWQGRWDSDSKTLTQTANLSQDITGTGTFRFVDDDTMVFSLTGKDRDGNVSVEGRSTFTRQQNAKPVVRQESKERSSKPPELKVLGKLVGTWTDEGVNKVAVWTPEEVRFKTTSSMNWILDGKCVWQAKPDAIFIYTFSEDERAYKFWHFNASGYVHEWTGEWDESTQTLTWKSNLDGNQIVSSVLTQVFQDDDSGEWSAIATDKQGKVYHHVVGKSTRSR